MDVSLSNDGKLGFNVSAQPIKLDLSLEEWSMIEKHSRVFWIKELANENTFERYERIWEKERGEDTILSTSQSPRFLLPHTPMS